jgi:hypothetical protein
MTMRTRTIIDTATMDWIGDEAEGMKMLHVNAHKGRSVFVIRIVDEVMPSHVHLGPSDFLLLKGELDYRVGYAPPDSWLFEPSGAIHWYTKHMGEVVYLVHFNGPVAYFGENRGLPFVLNANIHDGLTRAGGQFADMAELVRNGIDYSAARQIYTDEDIGIIVDPNTMQWAETDIEGVSVKVLNVDETSGEFRVLTKATAGSVIPARKYTAPADFYVLCGEIQFHDAKAAVDSWVYEPIGVNEGEMRHDVDTVYLATYCGAVLGLSADGAVGDVMDVESVRSLAASAVTL